MGVGMTLIDHEAVKPSRTTTVSGLNLTRIYPVVDVYVVVVTCVEESKVFTLLGPASPPV